VEKSGVITMIDRIKREGRQIGVWLQFPLIAVLHKISVHSKLSFLMGNFLGINKWRYISWDAELGSQQDLLKEKMNGY